MDTEQQISINDVYNKILTLERNINNMAEFLVSQAIEKEKTNSADNILYSKALNSLVKAQHEFLVTRIPRNTINFLQENDKELAKYSEKNRKHLNDILEQESRLQRA